MSRLLIRLRGISSLVSMATIERIPVIKSGNKVLVPIDQIQLLLRQRQNSCIYTGTMLHVYYSSAKRAPTPHGFFRIHRNFIVNLEYVSDVEVISALVSYS